jgi:hypothetical protein
LPRRRGTGRRNRVGELVAEVLGTHGRTLTPRPKGLSIRRRAPIRRARSRIPRSPRALGVGAGVAQAARPELPDDRPHLVQGRSSLVLHGDDALPNLFGSVLGDACELKQDAGEALPDLVVQLLPDAAPFPLERRERPPGAVAPLLLEALEHRVEPIDQRPRLGAAERREALSGPQHVERLLPLHQSVEPAEADPHQDGVRDDQ